MQVEHEEYDLGILFSFFCLLLTCLFGPLNNIEEHFCEEHFAGFMKTLSTSFTIYTRTLLGHGYVRVTLSQL